MNQMNRIKLYFILILLFTSSFLSASSTINSIKGDEKTKFKVEIRNSIGDPQTNVFLKITGRSEVFKADSCGIINFEYDIPESYSRTASIYLDEDPKIPEKTFTLDKNNTYLDFCIDSKSDILRFKQDNSTFYIEGIVTDEKGEPITGATVSIQGTGRHTFTDEIGLFSIDADFNHYIIIRADGMENLSMTVSPFLMNQHDAYNIVMRKKSGEKIYSSVETMPQYPGGMKYFKRYIDRNLKYPEEAKKNKIEGVVVMQFVVEKNGDITNPRVMRRLDESLDSVAMNLIKGMPRWIPASDYGIKVRCKYSVPIAFKIPVPKPVVVDSIPIKGKALADSTTIVQDSIIMKPDTLATDSLITKTIINDSITNDSVIITNDSIANDSTLIKKEIDNDRVIKDNKTKVKKRNIFVRFFRWLFGIKDKEDKTIENEKINVPDDEESKIESSDIDDKDRPEKEKIATVNEEEKI
ncbi:energy transducer TonB [Bacteroides caecigallinarum]|uniref:energy transducer TonB n=1 Tax=Bacteroides caecigallinarum TaxID=1411144 RepID=UPI00195C99CC|nr:energy transducer TonB [Bacteroides caecigallinarum]MBM6882566.1 TonB family protein [Bacteroides caecigallinarum]